MSLSNDEAQVASEKLEILQRADAFTQMMATPGWKEIYGLHVAWVETYHSALSKINTAETDKAIEALRQWQLAEEFLRLEADFINSTLRQADVLRGTVTLGDALMMEQYQNEQPKSSGDSAGSDRGGY